MYARGYESHVSVGLRTITQRFASLWINLFSIQSQILASLLDLLSNWLPSLPVLVIPELSSHLARPVESDITPHRRLYERLWLPYLPYSTIRALPFFHRSVR